MGIVFGNYLEGEGEGRDNWEKSTTLSLDRPLDSLTAGDNCWAELVGGNALRGAKNSNSKWRNGA